jgi:hypothetical protein
MSDSRAKDIQEALIAIAVLFLFLTAVTSVRYFRKSLKQAKEADPGFSGSTASCVVLVGRSLFRAGFDSIFGCVGYVVLVWCMLGVFTFLSSIPGFCLRAIEKVSFVAGSISKAAADGYESGRY